MVDLVDELISESGDPGLPVFAARIFGEHATEAVDHNTALIRVLAKLGFPSDVPAAIIALGRIAMKCCGCLRRKG